jgi:CRP/FNR family transcriptional regulator
MPEAYLEVLRLCPLFRDVPDTLLLELAERARVIELPRGQRLFSAGDAAESLYVIERSWLRVFKPSPDGSRELTVHLEGPRQALGSIAVFLEHSDYAAECAALEDARVLEIPASDVRHLINQPVFARAVIAHLARRHARLTERLEHLFFVELDERLPAFLLERVSDDGYALPTNSELASILGTVPELVSRKLGEFYRLGLIRLEKRRVWLVDTRLLEKMIR